MRRQSPHSFLKDSQVLTWGFLFWRSFMKTPTSLTFEDQLSLLQSRGMKVSKRDVNKLKIIGYYRIKQFAAPLANKNNSNKHTYDDYSGVNFSDVLTRYYQDKNLRIHLLHAIEKIEVALKTRLSFILGNSYGPFGYLNFSNWCDKHNYKKFEIETRQFQFKKSLLKSIKRSFINDVKDTNNQDVDGFPTIWLAVEVLTFGELVRIVEIMSDKNKKKLSEMFNCTKRELISWLKCLNFVRNICAHNANVIDLQLSTKPLCRKQWKGYLYTVNGDNSRTPSNKLGIVILIIKHFVNTINKKYGWRNINKDICRLVDKSDERAHLLGFLDSNTVYELFGK